MSEGPVRPRCILHADLDAFYASVEQMDRPELKGMPVLVGGSPEGRGVVAACSYEARAYGVHSAMPMRTAISRCPNAIIVPPRFSRYGEVSGQVMSIFRSIADVVQPLSLDEAYLDVTDVVSRTLTLREIAVNLKERVKAEVGLNISVGAATSKSVSKIASDLEKPNGLVVVEPGEERRFLAPLPAKKLSGIGPKTEQRLAAEGIKTLGQLAKRTDEWAQRMFGKWGPEMVALSRGEDNRPVATEGKGKSVSAETTFSRDISDRDEIADCVARLSSGVARRLGRSAAMGRTVTVKLRLSDFTTFTRSVTLASPVNDVAIIREMAQRLVSKELLPGRRFRLVGVGVSNFGEVRQLSLFDETKTSLR